MKKIALAALTSLILLLPFPKPAAATVLPAEQLPQSPPATPVVKDEGDWCKGPIRLHVTWETPAKINTPPVLEYQYRLRDRDLGLVKGTTSAGLKTAADIELSLQQEHKYFVEVRARNATGWSETGTSDGIIADLQGPRAEINAFVQTSVTLPGGQIYPNSFQVSLAGSDTGGSGFDKYLLTIRENFSLKDLSDLKSLRLSSSGRNVLSREVSAAEAMPIELSNLPYLFNGRAYTLTVKGVDKAGNIGEPVNQDCVAHFPNSLFPPLTKIQIRSKERPPRIIWDEVFDPSGIAEYQVAISVNNRPETWRRVGKALEYKLSQSPGKSWQVWVKAINGYGRESVSSLEWQEKSKFPTLTLPHSHTIIITPSK